MPARPKAASLARLALPLALLAVLPGCLPWHYNGPDLRDLRIEQVNILPADDPWVRRADVYPSWATIPREPVLVVDTTTDIDTSRYGRDYYATFFSKASVCNNGRYDTRQDITILGPYSEAEDLFYTPRQPIPPDRNKRYPLKIAFLMKITAFKIHDSSRSSDAYQTIDHDFRTQARDICFFFRGGAMGSLIPHRSRDFVLPYALVREALARAGLPYVPAEAPVAK